MKKHPKLLALALTASLSLAILPSASAAERKHLENKWPDVPCTVEFYCSGMTTSQISAVRAAMRTWNNVKQVDGSSLVTMATTTNSRASSTVCMDNYYSEWVGHCSFDAIGGQISSVEIELNSAYTLVVGKAANSYDIQSIALHELGHAVGVAHCHEDESGKEFLSSGNRSSNCLSSTCEKNALNPLAIPNSTARRSLQEYDTTSYQYIYY